MKKLLITLAAVLSIAVLAREAKLGTAVDLVGVVANSQADVPRTIIQAGGPAMASLLAKNCLTQTAQGQCVKAMSVLEATSIVADGKDSTRAKAVCSTLKASGTGYWHDVQANLESEYFSAIKEGRPVDDERFGSLMGKINEQVDAAQKICA